MVMNAFSLPVMAQEEEAFADVSVEEVSDVSEEIPAVETGSEDLFGDGTQQAAETPFLSLDPVESSPQLSTAQVGGVPLEINEANFPDAVFRGYVIAEYDMIKDLVLDEQELLAATDMDVNEMGISSLKGVELLTNLTLINCSSNSLTSLDVSKNTQLTSLDCSDNQITSLDFSNNLSLQELDVSTNLLTSLDVSMLSQLTSLDCGDNQLRSLNTDANPELMELDCGGNMLTSLTVSNNPKLTDLSCSDNSLSELDVSQNPSLAALDCSENELESLDLSNNAALTELNCSSNELAELDLSSNAALTELDCGDNQLVSLDLSNNPALVEVTLEGNEDLVHLDMGDNQQLADTVKVPAAVKAKAKLKKGTTFKYKGCKYKIIANDKNGVQVSLMGPVKKTAASVNVPDTVTYKKVKCAVTTIAPKAFSGCKKLRKVTLGANVTTIGKVAFSGCKSLSSLTIKSKGLKSVGAKSLRGISSKAVIKVPKAKLKAYKKLLKGKGQAKSVTIKK